MAVKYSDLVNKGGTIYNTQTGQGYSTPQLLATDLGVSPNSIAWGSIAKNDSYTPGVGFGNVAPAPAPAPAYNSTPIYNNPAPTQAPQQFQGLQASQIPGSPTYQAPASTPAYNPPPAPTPTPTPAPSTGLQYPTFDAALSAVYAKRTDLQALYNPDGTAKNVNDPKIAGIPTLADWAKTYGVNEEPTLKTATANAAGNNAPSAVTPTPTPTPAVTPTPTDTSAGASSGTSTGTSTNTSASTPAGTPAPNYQDTNQMKQTAVDAANKAAQAIFDSLGTTNVETRKSSEILAKLEQSIETPPPAPPSMAEQFNTLKTQLGLDPLQAQLTDLNNQVAALDTALLTESDKAGNRVQSMPEISRRRTTLQQNTDIQKAYLNTQISAVSAQVTNKLNTLNMIMGFTGQDYQNATAYYSANLDRNTTLYNLFNAAEQKDQSQTDKLKATAATNLTTIQNMLQEGKIKYENLTPAQQTQIALMEMQAGLPVGITAAISNQAAATNSKVLTTTSRQDPTGNTFYDSLIQKPDGSLSVISTSKGQEILTAAEQKANPQANTQNPAASSVGQRPSPSNPNVTEYYDTSTGQGFASPQALADFVNKKNGNTQATAANVFGLLQGNTNKTTPAPTTPTPKKTTVAEDVTSMNGKLATRKGPDGYLSPQDWKTAQNAWIDAGHSAASFKTNFQNYINPADPQDYK